MKAREEIEAFALALDAAFERIDFDARTFPALAGRALREAALPDRLAAADVVRFVLEDPALPEQDDLDSRFGQPAITLFHGRRFYIQVLFWVDETTSIHEHGSSGAFQVLQGTSVHSEYELAVERVVDAHLQIGDVRFRRATLLGRGEVVEITNALAHNLFHLDHPSATLVVRTYSEPAAQPQFTSHPPHVAIDPFFQDPRADAAGPGARAPPGDRRGRLPVGCRGSPRAL